MTTVGHPQNEINAPNGLTECLALLPKLREIDAANIQAARAVAKALDVPASMTMILSETALLLEAYWISDRPREMVKREAERWADALAPYPEWALKEAFRWYTGMDNPRLHSRPVEGDIQRKAHELTGPLRALKTRIETYGLLQAGGAE